MPTVIRESGLAIMIYTDDHAPAHVHVWHQGCYAVIEFENEITIRENHGLNRRLLRRGKQIVGENREFLQNEWRRIYG